MYRISSSYRRLSNVALDMDDVCAAFVLWRRFDGGKGTGDRRCFGMACTEDGADY